jgi:tyrosinase
MYRLLFSQPDLNYFSGSLWDDGQIVFPYDNLESIHDSVHIAIGGELDNNTVRGTMWYINSAAFDPVFWMHHAMVDRIFGFWQVLHPDNWLASINSTSTWTIPPEELVNGTTRKYFRIALVFYMLTWTSLNSFSFR